MLLEKIISCFGAAAATLLVMVEGEKVYHGFKSFCIGYANVANYVSTWTN